MSRHSDMSSHHVDIASSRHHATSLEHLTGALCVVLDRLGNVVSGFGEFYERRDIMSEIVDIS